MSVHVEILKFDRANINVVRTRETGSFDEDENRRGGNGRARNGMVACRTEGKRLEFEMVPALPMLLLWQDRRGIA